MLFCAADSVRESGGALALGVSMRAASVRQGRAKGSQRDPCAHVPGTPRLAEKQAGRVVRALPLLMANRDGQPNPEIEPVAQARRER